MMTTIESYVRFGRGQVRKWAMEPKIRLGVKLGVCFLGGLICSGAGLSHTALPLTMGLVCVMYGWNALLVACGGAVGYLLFWGRGGIQCLPWLGCGLAAALGLGKRRILEESPLLMSAIGALIVSASGLAFQIFLEEAVPVPQYLLRVALGGISVKLFELVRDRRDRLADWVAMGFGVLALARIAPFGFSLGHVAAGALAAAGPLPAAALAGLALDLAQLTRTPMTAALCFGWLTRMIPVNLRQLRYLVPGAVYLLVMGLSGNREYLPFFALTLGALLGGLAPAAPELTHRRGETGLAQVRLELMAQVLTRTQQLLLEESGSPIDEEALLLRTRERACGSCPNRKNCGERLNPLPTQLLHNPLAEVSALPVPCKKPGRMILELRRTQEQFRALRADRQRQGEYRTAVIQQYQFLSGFLRQQSDLLSRRQSCLRQRFEVEVTVCSAGREDANGDRCLSFAGTGCRHYVLLCDGMGTGLGAAQEGRTAVTMLQQMITAGFPAEYALRSLNSLLVLRCRAAAVTVDLVEIGLDSGRATIYKWGAAPSYLIYDGGAEKIGTATPPPGLSMTEDREKVERLSLRRGEVLIVTSDGVEVESTLRRMRGICRLPPGELAAKLLELGGRKREDDATVAAVRLIPAGLST